MRSADLDVLPREGSRDVADDPSPLQEAEGLRVLLQQLSHPPPCSRLHPGRPSRVLSGVQAVETLAPVPPFPPYHGIDGNVELSRDILDLPSSLPAQHQDGGPPPELTFVPGQGDKL